MTVVSDTSPLNYLVLIGAVRLLPDLLGRIALPEAVHRELLDAGAPELVRTWARQLPSWVTVHPVQAGDSMLDLDPGETEAIVLAETLRADLLLMDDRKAVDAARARGLTVVGTLGLLVRGAQAGLTDATALDRLRATNFRAQERLFQDTAERIRQAR